MTWVAPHTATTETITAAIWNSDVRDKFADTATAHATNPGDYFVATGANAITPRGVRGLYNPTTQTTTSTGYTDLASPGPSVTLTTGATALVWIAAEMANSTAGASAKFTFAVSGATTIGASDDWSVIMDGNAAASPTRRGCAHLVTLTAGSNTFTMKYAVGSGTGSFGKREIDVMPF